MPRSALRFSDLQIRPSIKLDRSLCEAIEQSYRSVINDIGPEEYIYVLSRFPKKLQILTQAGTSWLIELADRTQFLFSILESYSTGHIKIDEKSQKLIGAALFYFCNPYDIIPDHIPGTGNLDDAYVVNLCLKELQKVAPDLILHYLSFKNESVNGPK